ncbi:MAG: helix-turn-helix domain-containing protein [Bacteroidota bacterium]
MNALAKALAADLAQLLRPLVEEAVANALPDIPSSGAEPKAWLTNREAMEYLGLSKATLARYRKDGTLPHSKVGANVFYRFADVDALLKASLRNGD